MKVLRRELFRCFSCILILGSKRTNFSHKKNSSWRTLLSLDDARNDFRGEVSLASICKFKKRDLLFFFQQIPDTEYTLGVQLKL